MPCYHPLTAYELTGQRTENGKAVIVFNNSEISGPSNEITVPCGRCIGCRLEKSRQWAMRMMHEAQTTEEKGLYNSFITLTYDEDHYAVSLDKSDFPAFMKRLRTFHKRNKWSIKDQKYIPRVKGQKVSKIRFVQCGEYGEQKGRRHHHAAIFGYDFPDKEPWEVTDNGDVLYRSATLEKLWQNGRCIVGQLEWQSCAYISRYTTKKVNGAPAEHYYKAADVHTGEILPMVPEYITMSRRPGIGKDWLEKYGRDIYGKDYVTVNGHRQRTTAYYDKELDKRDPEALQALKKKRLLKAKEDAHDATLKRLQVKEAVKKAQTRTLTRRYEK